MSVAEQRTGVDLADELTLLIKSHAAKDERDTKSTRVRRGEQQGLVRGVHQGAWPCYGYDAGTPRLGPDGRPRKEYTVDPQAA